MVLLRSLEKECPWSATDAPPRRHRSRLVYGVAAAGIAAIGLTALLKAKGSESSDSDLIAAEPGSSERLGDPLGNWLGVRSLVQVTSVRLVDEVKSESSGTAAVWEVQTTRALGDFYSAAPDDNSLLRVYEPLSSDGGSLVKGFLQRTEDQAGIILLLQEVMPELDVAQAAGTNLSVADIGQFAGDTIDLQYGSTQDEELIARILEDEVDPVLALSRLVGQVDDLYSLGKVGDLIAPFASELVAGPSPTSPPVDGAVDGVYSTMLITIPADLKAGQLVTLLNERGEFLYGFEVDGVSRFVVAGVPSNTASLDVLVDTRDGDSFDSSVDLVGLTPETGLVVALGAVGDGSIAPVSNDDVTSLPLDEVNKMIDALVAEQPGVGGPSEGDEVGSVG
jgi:hypothetical protein